MFQRLHFRQATLMACGAAEAGAQESFDQFYSPCGFDELSAQTDDIHVVIFDALSGGEVVMDKPGPASDLPGEATATAKPVPVPQITLT